MAAAAGEGEATRQKRKKRPKPNHVGLEVAPPQSSHASKPLPSAPFLQTPTQSPTPGTPILEEAAAAETATMKRDMRKEQKVSAPPLPRNPTLEAEEQGKEAVLAKKKKKRKETNLSPSPSPSAAAAAEADEHGKEAVLATKKKKRKEPNSSPSPSAAAAAAAETPVLEQEAEAVLATKKKKHKEPNSSPSPSAADAAETPVLEQEAKVRKKRKRSKEQRPSGYSPLPVDSGQTQSQGAQAPLLSKPLPAAPAHSPAPGTPILEEAPSQGAMRKMKMPKEQKVAVLTLSHDPTLEEQVEEPLLATTTKKKHKERKKSSLSQSAAAAAETPILPQMLEEAAGAALSLAQNTNLEQQREDAIIVEMKKEPNHMEHTPSLSTSVAAETPILEQEAKVNKKHKQRKMQELSGKSALPLDPGHTHCVRSQGGKAPPEQVRTCRGIKKNNGKRLCGLNKRELIKEGSKKPHVLPEGFVPFSDFVSSCTEQNPDHPPPYIAFFDQFRYNPIREDRKFPPPRTPDRLARLPPRGHSSLESSQLTTTSRALKSSTSVASKTKQQDSGSGSQGKLNVEVKKNSQKKRREKKPANETSKANNSVARKPKKKDSGSGSSTDSQEKLHAKEKKKPVLTRAEKCSDIYRRVPLDQLVPPLLSPHNLLQEKYASDPWKVIVICMLLNLTQGKQVKKIIEGFFECYPDANSAFNADPQKMAGYLEPLGLQCRKTTRIQKFSKEYLENEWTYITELCGVGKYAADAYAIFCAGRATEVVPKDHKLVDYWKYVCFELPMLQESQNVQEAGVPEQELAVSVIC